MADTSAVVSLIDADDLHHEDLSAAFGREPEEWVLPWAILPEVDYLVRSHLGDAPAALFMTDITKGGFVVEWGGTPDILRARELCERHADLRLGLVDAVVMATAERLGAEAIATLDLRDFGAVNLEGSPKLIPRDA